ncbi:MAG: ABC transporter ATP-binding protein [Nisaea sp.]|uniref:ABC transporter ATP-binding protein/permease n=1 Tax=Nisaea sp. TaxID=2024842 RepID=UPI001B057C64|nr:ABC transporter ATP-binding protein [Nisaea sp.]MBO6559531.1 ABC transporter ATP-binding protein [Nisaea sp.]
MHFETRLWQFTEGVRGRISWAILIGLLGVSLGVARLGLLGWLIGQVFAGKSLQELWPAIAGIALVMIARGWVEQWRNMVAHETAAKVQISLRRKVYDKLASLGPAYVGRERSGTISLALTDAVDRLEVYFGQYLPQLAVSLLTPVLIFVFVAWIDLPVAAVMLAFALIAVFAPSLWHSSNEKSARRRQQAYASFAAEFLDSLQGLATLKAFGQSKARGDILEVKAREVFRSTMWVLSGNVLARGITDSSIACGAAAALALGAFRVTEGQLELTSLLVILMLGVEVFRPMRELRNVLHEGMVGLSAAKGIYRVLDGEPDVEDTLGAANARLEPSIAFEQVGFRYPGNQRTVHDGLDFAVKPGERIGLVGPSGCGKSSVVRLLLRFFDPVEGRILLGGKPLNELSFEQIRSMISVVNQDTFLFHGTVEENIRMGDPGADHAAVVAAAKAANIHDFIEGLPDGYRTVIGERGIKLSGGQRQRVAIARALLRDTPILVLDEALSAVDAENEAVIQDALNRLMKGRTTLVLAHRLSSVIDCDRILVLDHGKVVEEGTHAALMKAGGIYAGLMAEQAREAAAAKKSEPVVREEAPKPATETLSDIPGGAVQAPTEGIIKAEGLSWFEVVVELMKVIMPWKGRLIFTFLFGVLRVVGFIGVGVLSALVVLALKNGEDFTPYLWGLAAVAPLSGVLHWLESWLAHDMAFRLLAEMRVEAYRKLDALAPAYLVRRRTGDLMTLVTHDIELVEYFFAHTVAPAFVAILVPGCVLLWLGAESPTLALALIPFLLAVGISPFLMRRRVDRLGSEAREASGELGAFAVDSVQGLGEIVAFQQEAERGDKLDQLGQRHIDLRLPFFRELTAQQSLLEALTGLGGLAIVVTGAALAAAGTIDAGVLPLLTILAMAAFLPVSEIAQIGRQLADTLGSTRRVYGLWNEPVPVRDGPGVAAKEGPVSLALEKVDFRYPGQNRRAIRDFTLEVPAGRTVALVGTSGAGKTTLAQMLMRFWDPDAGRVLMNGTDLRDYRLDELRSRIALVAQDTYLFNDTLRANILLAKPGASEEELKAAVRHASLEDLVAMLPDGLDTPVGERGTSLSGGQRQRVAIARAFLKDAPVLILDEATSHLDAVNERAVRVALDRLQSDRTTVVIAHRLSTIRDADLIAVLSEGALMETGTHEDLVAKGGLYAKLVSHQLASAVAAE